VARTTVLRTVAFKEGFRPSSVRTHTYLFPSDVVEQPAHPAGFPTTWTGADYGMENEPADLARIAGDVSLDAAEARAMLSVDVMCWNCKHTTGLPRAPGSREPKTPKVSLRLDHGFGRDLIESGVQPTDQPVGHHDDEHVWHIIR